MSCRCDLDTLKWLYRLPLAFLSLVVSLAGCAVVLLGLLLTFLFRRKEFPKAIAQLGLILMEAPCFVMRTCYTDVTDHKVEASTMPSTSASFPQPTPPQHSQASCSDDRRTSSSGSKTPSMPSSIPSNAVFSYEELVAATNGFSDANLLGEGGFGYVHKGTLSDGRLVAVKQLKHDNGWAASGFHIEIDVISRVHHRHLVCLIGCCIDHGSMLLVFEYVPNKTLHFHLHESESLVDWDTRLKIAIGSAKGLAYLHEECQPRIVHRDIKTENIILDHSFEAKVADFGLAKFLNDGNSHVSTRVMGTIGYLAPEYASTGQLTDKSDVFSFGVVLLELITGRKPVMKHGTAAVASSLVDWARPLCAQVLHGGDYGALIDPRLGNSYNPDGMKQMIACASACVQFSAARRPNMSQVVRVLGGILSPADFMTDAAQSSETNISISYSISDLVTSSSIET